MYDHAWVMFLAILSAAVLQALITFSTPFIRVIYFLETSALGSVRFGLWGYCDIANNVCSSERQGYTFQPEITNQTLTEILILYPISTGICALCLFAPFPLLCFQRLRYYPHPIFCMLTLLAFLTSLAALTVALIIFISAISRFHELGFSASLGPAIWMSVASAGVLLLVAFNAGCGTCMGGRFGRGPAYLPYNY